MAVYIAHHGILGQKWGKKNGPPYPLDPKTDYSAAERRQQKQHAKYTKKLYKKRGRQMYDDEELKQLSMSDNIVKAGKNFEDASAIYKYFGDNTDHVWEKYAVMAAKVAAKKNSTELTESLLDHYLRGDGDQGQAFHLYCVDNKIDQKKIARDMDEAIEQYDSAVQQCIDSQFGKYKNLKANNKYTQSLGQAVTDSILALNERNGILSNYYYIGGYDWGTSDSEAVKEYDRLFKEIKEQESGHK